MKKNKYSGRAFFVITIMIFLLLFTYSSLNLKNIDYGYEMQKLMKSQELLNEEIDVLESKRAKLLELGRIENIVVNKLGYTYPSEKQIIRIYED